MGGGQTGRTGGLSAPLVAVLVVLGCGKDNPGFKLDETFEDPGPVTATGTTAWPTTADPIPTTTLPDPSSSTGPSVTSETTTTTTSDDTGFTETGTTENEQPPEFHNDCEDEDRLEFRFKIEADTFYKYLSDNPGEGCAGTELEVFCEYASAGKAPSLDIFGRQGSFQVMALRFAPAVVKYDEEHIVPLAYLTLELRIFFERTVEDADREFWPLRFHDVDQAWPEGPNAMLGECGPNDSSFECRLCAMPGACAKKWQQPLLDHILGDVNPAGSPFVISGEPNGPGAYQSIVLNAVDEIPRLAESHPGYLIASHDEVLEKRLRAHSRESGEGKRPHLVASYCPPK